MLSKFTRQSLIKNVLNLVTRPLIQKRDYFQYPLVIKLMVGKTRSLSGFSHILQNYIVSNSDHLTDTQNNSTMQSTNYCFDLSAMSADKLMFNLKCSLTVGPKDNSKLLMITSDKELVKEEQIKLLIKNILECEIRIRATQFYIDEIFSNREIFKEVPIREVQQVLDKFGIQIINANINELCVDKRKGEKVKIDFKKNIEKMKDDLVRNKSTDITDDLITNTGLIVLTCCINIYCIMT